MPDDQDSVVREIEIAAPIEQVWELISHPEHLRVWFAFDGAEVDLRLGGLIEHFWREHGRYFGVIERLEPPKLLAYRYGSVAEAIPEPGRQTHVEFALREVPGGRTLVRVTESGFADLALTDAERRAHRAATEQGWGGGLDGLAEHGRRVLR